MACKAIAKKESLRKEQTRRLPEQKYYRSWSLVDGGLLLGTTTQDGCSI